MKISKGTTWRINFDRMKAGAEPIMGQRLLAPAAVDLAREQYAVLLVKPKNVNRTVTALRKCCKTMRPATHPLDVLFAAMGYEGGEDLGRGGGADEGESA